MTAKNITICLLSVALLGMNVVVSKLGVQHFPPILFASLRLMILLPLIAFFPRPQMPYKTLMLISILWAMIYGVGMNVALFSGISAGATVLMLQSSTFISIILAGLFLNERPKIPQWTGVVIGFLGLYLVCKHQGLTVNMLGFLALLISSISFSLGTLLVKKSNPDPINMMVWMAAIAAIPMFLISNYWEGTFWQYVQTATAFDWSMVIFAGCGSMLLGGSCWIFVLNSHNMTTVMPFRMLIPVFACTFAYLLLGERYPSSTVLGGIVIMLGLAVTQIIPTLLQNLGSSKHVPDADPGSHSRSSRT